MLAAGADVRSPEPRCRPGRAGAEPIGPARAEPPVTDRARPAPAPKPAAPRPTADAGRRRSGRAAQPWVEPNGDVCPDDAPGEGEARQSKIFHVPGRLNYDRTNPDRCYHDAAAAEADGLRPAKR